MNDKTTIMNTRYGILLSLLLLSLTLPIKAQENLLVKKCEDFNVNGKGDHREWEKTNWVALKQLDGGKPLETEIKVMYSGTGLYVLFRGEDEKITSAYLKDFDPLYNADVFEVFFHPDPQKQEYFEYEISPLNKELVLYMTHFNNQRKGVPPGNYEGNRKTRKAVFTQGKAENGAPNDLWMAEVYIPFKLMSQYQHTPPASGTKWNANFYRLDYDSGKQVKWAWSPVKSSFHETDKYQPIRFE